MKEQDQTGKDVNQKKNKITNLQTHRLAKSLIRSFAHSLIFTFGIFFAVMAVRQHYAFQTNGMDVGNVDQALWNTARGDFLRFSLMTPIESRLALHVEPILLLFVPFYWLNLGSPELLLIVQALIVALGAWPLYRIAEINFVGADIDLAGLRKNLRGLNLIRSLLPLIITLAYLLLPTLESALLFEFHAVTLAPTFIIFAFLALEREKNIHFIIFSLLAIATKEDMPLVVAMMGLYVGLSRGRWRLAGLTVGLSLTWFVLALFVIQPHFADGGNIQLTRYAWLGDNPLAMLYTIITNPVLVFNHLWYKVGLPVYLFTLLFPTAFLVFLNPLTLIPTLPTLAINLLSDNSFSWRLEDFHYGVPLAPFLFISTIYGIKRINGAVKNSFVPLISGLLLLTCSLVYHHYRGFTPLSRSFNWPEVTEHHRQLEAVLKTIPTDSALFTQSNLAPHLTHRQTIYTDFAYFTDPGFSAPILVNDILLDITSFENIGGLHQFLRQKLLESGEYKIVTAQDGIIHLKPFRTIFAVDTPLPVSFYSFAKPTVPPDYKLSVDFGDMVRLNGLSLHFNRQEEVQVSIDLEPLQPLTDIQPVLYLLDDIGQPVGAVTELQPGLVWFPPEMWQMGETVRLRFNTLPWHTRQTINYRLALGLISGGDVWDTSRRYRPTIEPSSPYAPRLPADGTLFELARIKQIWDIPSGSPLLRQFSPPVLEHSIEANFNNRVKLLGYTTPKNRAGEIEITLYWQADNNNQPPVLTRFVQLVGSDGLVYGQNDSAPDKGTAPTNLWQPGEVVQETVTFPIQDKHPPGLYNLHIGLYHPDTGQRLPLIAGGDHIEIGVEMK